MARPSPDPSAHDDAPAERPDHPTAAFAYDLPPELIAQHPAPERDASRLLVLDRASGDIQHRAFRDLPDLVTAGDILVLNETRVFPARLLGTRRGGGAAEIVLLHPAAGGERAADRFAAHTAEWTALVRPGAKLKPGAIVTVAPDLSVEIVASHEDGTRHVRLRAERDVRAAIERHGLVPLPPYIERAPEPEDVTRYQTVYARAEGSVAAPTAGLHFTPALLETLRRRGVERAHVVLHVGVGTFRPVEVEDPAEHEMHAEWYEVTDGAAARINHVRRRGGRLWAVGTTVARTLESAAAEDGEIQAGSGWTRLFIRPGYRFRAVDALITNFHLPRSTLLMLVSAFAGYERTRAAYAAAIAERYRFYSYGDAMAIV